MSNSGVILDRTVRDIYMYRFIHFADIRRIIYDLHTTYDVHYVIHSAVHSNDIKQEYNNVYSSQCVPARPY